MKAQFGAIVTDGRGKIGGQVMSKNRAGSYMRTKVTPVNRQTASQSTIRERLTGFSQAWRGLTDAQRTAWNNAVGDYARTDIFGNLRNPSGFTLFQRLNNNLSAIGIAQIDSPPLPSAVGTCTAGVLTYTSGTPALSLALSNAVPSDTKVKVFATAPVSAGKSFVKSEYRLISVLASAATSPANLLSAYTTKFGAVGAVGTKIFVKLVCVNSVTGQEGSPSMASAISAT